MRKKELLGLSLLLVGAVGIYFSAKQTPAKYEYLTATRDISPGDIVTSADFARSSMDLSKSAAKYVSAGVRLTGHRSLRRISRGEIIPRDALTREIEIERRHLLTFTVAKSSSPRTLKVGDLVDIYFFSISSGAALTEEIRLLKVAPKIRVHTISVDENQIDGPLTISALIEERNSTEYMTLIATSRIALVQRFDDVA